MSKRIVQRSPRVYDAKRDFTTSSGGSGFNMGNNPLAKGTRNTGGGS